MDPQNVRDEAMSASRDSYDKTEKALNRENAVIFRRIAQSLARGYTDLYYVNMDTDELIEYYTDDEFGVLREVRRSDDFFEGCRRDVRLFVHPDDQAAFVEAMDREFLTKALDREKVFEMIYRRIKNGRSFYVKMRVSRAEEDPRFIVLAVSDIDELMKRRFAEERIQEEHVIYSRLHALTGSYIAVYVVDPETETYREFSAAEGFEELFADAKEGDGFFAWVREAARQYLHPSDLIRFLSVFTKEKVLAEIERSGIFTLPCRVRIGGKTVHVQVKAAVVEEKEGTRIVVGLNDIDAQVRQEEEYERRLAEAQELANIDALTNVKNKHAFLEYETRMDRQIMEHRQAPFAVVMFDVNNLKKVNDTLGHQAGDQLLCDACTIICDTFKHSPVFRVGGDEFVVIAHGSDYTEMEDRLEEMRTHNSEALANGGVVIACGMARYEDQACVAAVFDLADRRMYEEKMRLKQAVADRAG